MVMIKAVLFDLDDTLFGQVSWLDQAWERVAEAASPYGVDHHRFLNALRLVAAEGSDRGRIIDRALERIGAGDGLVPVAPLVEAFRAFDNPTIAPYPGVKAAVARLRSRGIKVGLVTDGDPALQWSKLEALGLDDAFDTIVMSDEQGRENRKPNPAPFRAAAEALGVKPAQTVFIGDRPDKDVNGAKAASMRAIRVRSGEYRKVDNDVEPWHDVPHAVAAVALIEKELGPAEFEAAGRTEGGQR